ncbi:DUF3168 domain-containing protein [Mesorhizobium sp. DCY119]|uniref:DUF3168 domain-containing protein n=1 Tax=Mesorhizobium sp. DCY119 TaxID=2108445 RepID=UPI000E6D4D35|nr:DUF3168 domain-containing protein [Mesorhizobium sp. DCY119]RJG44913.1 DUF3168 domain-containing protein [Mesorhizobium sp. DCY119]
MAEPSLALQGAILSTIKNHTAAGANVFDKVTPNVFPRIQIGNGQTIPNDATCVDGFDVFFQIDVYSNLDGYPQAKAIAGEIHGLLHKKPLAVSGFNLVDLYLAGAVFTRETDDTISRARIMVEAQLEAL